MIEMDEAIGVLSGLAGAFMPELAQEPRRSPARRQTQVLPPDGLVVIDDADNVVSLDAAAAEVLGRGAEQVSGRPFSDWLRWEGAGDGVVRRPDGRRVGVAIVSLPFDSGDGSHRLLILRDREGRQRFEDELVRAEARYRSLVEQIPAVTFLAALDEGLNELYISPQIESLLGYSQEEWLSDPVLWYHRLHPKDRDLWNEEFSRGCQTGGPFRAECRFLARDGRVVWVHGEARIVRDEAGRPLFLQGIAFDITETKTAEEVVRASLREKEVMLKEIHHRVKNNLQITSSLLKLQSAQVKDPDARQLLRESQDRIRSMSLVHEKLYQSDDLSRVDFAAYVRTLAGALVRSYAAPVELLVDVRDVQLGVDQAVPCGLVINELVSNALKHAFRGRSRGVLQVSMYRVGDSYELVVSDDGVGLPEGLDPGTSASLGLQLVTTLAEQLGGVFAAESEHGTRMRVRFRAGRGGSA